METWENVLILGLVSISVIVLMNHNVPLDLIPLLDNSVFQLAIVGATLAVAVISPPVAIVAIATIVVVYYVRNLIKVQLINNTECNEFDEMRPDNEPRLIMEEVKTVETVTTTQHIKIQESDNSVMDNVTNAQNLQNRAMLNGANTPMLNGANAPMLNAKVENTKSNDNDVLENALKEHQYRVSEQPQMHVQNYKIPGAAPVPDIKPLAQDDFPNPRTSVEGFNVVASTDPTVQVYGLAPPPSTENYILDGNTNIGLTKGTSVPIEYNEMSAPPTARLYSNNEGQYLINENRPYSNPQKYEIADFMPGNDLGKNDFNALGKSIDDKITNLKKGIVTSMSAPPNFDEVVPRVNQNPNNVA